MGANFSRRPTRIAITAQLSSYEASVQTDPELQFLDTLLQQRTSRAISSLAAGVEFNSLSFDSLREVTGCLLDMNQEVVKVVLECQKDIWNNGELFDLVDDYFKCSLHIMDFCASLEKCVKRARDSQSIIQEALRLFAKEDAEEVGGEGVFKYAKTVEELGLFKAAGDPFDEEFFEILQTVYGQQLVMLEKLQWRKKKLAKRIKTIKAWRKVSSVIFVATFAAVLICSVVAAAIAAPPVASILAAAAAIPIGSIGKWIGSLFKKYQDTVAGDKNITNSMWVGTRIVIKDLKNISFLVDNFEIKINSLLSDADFALSDHEAVEIVIEEITRKLEVFMNSIDDLGKQADICSRNVGRARTLVLNRISKPQAE